MRRICWIRSEPDGDIIAGPGAAELADLHHLDRDLQRAASAAHKTARGLDKLKRKVSLGNAQPR